MVLKEIKQILTENNLAAQKKFGQNFLIDENIINNIIDKSEINKNISVIEIGPGLGSLTNIIKDRCNKLLCYEIDHEIANLLQKRYDGTNVTIIEDDFLKRDVGKDIDEYLKNEDIYVISNLPYYITTSILIKLIENKNRFKRFVLMLQKEVADRICGSNKTKDYNALSVYVQYYTDAKQIIQVSPNCFYPAPDVSSTVVRFDILDSHEPSAIDELYFNAFNRIIFSHKRKTLYNNLKNNSNISTNTIEKVLNKMNYSKTVRSEELSVNEIVELSNAFYEESKNGN